MNRTLIWYILSILFVQTLPAAEQVQSPHAISHENGGRFGDRVLGYTNARYLSYSTGIPFLYTTFSYSEHLTIDYDALAADQHSYKYTNKFYINSAESLAEFFCKIRDPKEPPTIFVVDYFPSDLSEWDTDYNRSVAFDIPWNDEEFKSYLKQCLSSRLPIPDFREPGCLNVATHVRTLSGGDTPEGSLAYFPLKHPTSAYHKRQIKRVYEFNMNRPMHVFLFSDTNKPAELLQEFREYFRGYDITFNMQMLEHPDLSNVVQDFFAMQQFDVLIATRSNFSMMAACLGSFDMILYPAHAEGRWPEPSTIDRVQIISKASDWFPYSINQILKNR